MFPSKLRLAAVVALIGAGSVALPALAQPEVAPLTVDKAPTSIRLDVTGLPIRVVFKQVHHAAYTVCNNALANHELTLDDHAWCVDGASTKAMRQFEKFRRAGTFADSGVIVLSAR